MSAGPVADPARRAELAERLAEVEERIGSACAAAGRPRDDVRLVVVTKFFPAADVAALVDLGVGDVGENRDQEAGAKVAELEAAGTRPARVHFVGQLQSNKAASVARYADVVHSLDRTKIVRALDRGAARAGRRLGALVQVGLDGDGARGGVPAERVDEVVAAVAEAESLDLRGLMAVAPLGADPADAFARLAAISERVRRAHPEATWLSAGMSGDLEAAVAAGATHLRVGSAILGPRPRHR